MIGVEWIKNQSIKTFFGLSKSVEGHGLTHTKVAKAADSFLEEKI
jgi:hypothetical protein